MYKKGQTSIVGERIKEYCKSHRTSMERLALSWGLPASVVERVIYKRQERIAPKIAAVFKEHGFDLSGEFRIADTKTPRRVVIFKDRVSEDVYNKIMEMLGRNTDG